MKRHLAPSNLAWELTQDSEVAGLLEKLGISHIEVAPTKIWKQPHMTPVKELRAYREFWNSRGIEIYALQSLLFGQEALVLFGTSEVRKALLAQLSAMFRVAQELGAKKLVFGSPKNRKKGSLSKEGALEIAVPFFQEVGELALKAGVCLCIEPNAPEYGCDFITTSDEGAELVARVNSGGIRLHLDWACMELAGENPKACLSRHGKSLAHFHLSSPKLGPIDGRSEAELHALLGAVSKSAPQLEVISLEMLNPGSSLATLESSLRKVLQCA